MVDFGATKVRRAKDGYLGHRVRGDASRSKRIGMPKPGPISHAEAKIAEIKRGGDIQQRVKSLSKQSRRAVAFNLEDDDDEVLLNGAAAVPASRATRRDIINALQDDFDDTGLILSDDEERDKQLNPLMTRTLQFGRGGAATEDAPPQRLSRKEKLAELITGSKVKRAQTAKQVYEQAALLEDTNEGLKDVLKDLEFRPTRHAKEYQAVLREEAEESVLHDVRSKKERSRDEDFDALLRQLATQPRGKAEDRKRTAAELEYEKKRRRVQQEARMAEDIARGAQAEHDESDGEDDIVSDDDRSTSGGSHSESSEGPHDQSGSAEEDDEDDSEYFSEED